MKNKYVLTVEIDEAGDLVSTCQSDAFNLVDLARIMASISRAVDGVERQVIAHCDLQEQRLYLKAFEIAVALAPGDGSVEGLRCVAETG